MTNSCQTYAAVPDAIFPTFHPPRKDKDVMTDERWARIKQLQQRPTLMFKSCQPQKAKGTRATYRKSEHGAS